jgi:hypothetical protein
MVFKLTLTERHIPLRHLCGEGSFPGQDPSTQLTQAPSAERAGSGSQDGLIFPAPVDQSIVPRLCEKNESFKSKR